MNQIEHPAAQLMILHRMTAAELAAQVGIRRGSLYLILQRQRRCSWEVAKKLGAVLGLQVGSQMPERYRLLLATGFCGGFSTFSTFTAETWQLAQSGQTSTALINVAANMGVCVLGLLLGMKLVH